MEKILFCRVADMDYYDGIKDGDIPRNSGSYPKETNSGGEIKNFHLYEDNKYYGFVETGIQRGKHKQLHIERIDDSSKKSNFISGVTVVFCASENEKGNVIVGWYKNATVFRHLIKENDKIYNIVSDKENVFLLEREKRNYFIPNARSGKIGIGRSHVWFADKDTPEVKEIVDNVLTYINNYDIINSFAYSDTFGEVFFESGLHIKKLINTYERNIKARNDCIKQKGCCCEICGFDAKKVYGEEFAGKIHVHHIVPISQRTEKYQIDSAQDLIPVCPNCHMILHTEVNGRYLSPEELKKRYEKIKKESNSK